jgi:DNA helicase-2/ATP-dependent DNA helicase PcrA
MTTPPPDDGQSKLVASESTRVLALGGPGSGKTQAALKLARRLIEAEPKGSGRVVLFLTFSRAAVSELLDRMPTLLRREDRQHLEIATFHSFARTLLDEYGRFDGAGIEPLGITSREEKGLGLSPDGSVEFDALVPAAVTLLTKAAWIRERFQRRFIAVVCDEFQDTNTAQHRLLEILAEGSRLICLGDPDQMIYDFIPGVSPQRLENYRATGPEVIELEPLSYRDPTGLIPSVARAIRDRRFDDPAFAQAVGDGRLRIHTNTEPLFPRVVAEVRALRASGHKSVGVFLTKKVFVEELGRALGEAGIEHEIAGLDGASGEAEVVVGTMALFAVGLASWDAVCERIAVFLTAAQPRSEPPNVALMLIGTRKYMSGSLPTRLENLQKSLLALVGRPTADLYPLADTFMAPFGWGDRLWRTGSRDLASQSIAIGPEPLNEKTATELDAVARRRKTDGYIDDFGTPQLPVRIMTTHQAKGREMDAVIIVHHNDDYIPTADKLKRVHFVAVSRARNTVSIMLPSRPNMLVRAYANLGRPAPASQPTLGLTGSRRIR